MKLKNYFTPLLVIGLLLVGKLMYGQHSGYYYWYDFEQFLLNHSTGAAQYKQVFSDYLRYPPICKENNLEGDIEFLLFHHGDGKFEIVQKKTEVKPFESVVVFAFEKAKSQLQEGIQEKFITTIRIRFDMEPYSDVEAVGFHFICTAPKVITKTRTTH